jgi:formylglycine-generating enzyme required for sulfatase activity
VWWEGETDWHKWDAVAEVSVMVGKQSKSTPPPMTAQMTPPPPPAPKPQPKVGDRIASKVGDVSFNERVIPAPPCGKPFVIMETQVTQELYRAVTGQSPSEFSGDQLPVENVSWEDGIAFCNALSKKLGLRPAYQGTDNNCKLITGTNGFRLPFEAEWEFAAKGGQNFKFSGSDDLDEVGWYPQHDGGNVHENITQPVAQLKPNGYGLYDMSGNVYEWCADDYKNPGMHRFEASASQRAIRGGCWRFPSEYSIVTKRLNPTPDKRDNMIGLRLTRSLDHLGGDKTVIKTDSLPPWEDTVLKGSVILNGGFLGFGKKKSNYQVNCETQTFNVGGVSFKMVRIPGKNYSLSQTQVTQALYRVVTGQSPSKFTGDQRPVERVSWEDGIAFCNALSVKLGLTPAYEGTNNNCELISGANGFRLPFEAEWEFAAKGGQNFKFAGSDNIDEVAWYGGYLGDGNVEEDVGTQPVAQLKANSYGLYDMSGNVREWCADDYDHPGQHRLGVSKRAIRGGCWLLPFYADHEVSSRDGEPFGERHKSLGLRLSRSLD